MQIKTLKFKYPVSNGRVVYWNGEEGYCDGITIQHSGQCFVGAVLAAIALFVSERLVFVPNLTSLDQQLRRDHLPLVNLQLRRNQRL